MSKQCDCDWTEHDTHPCTNSATTGTTLCFPCLFCCEEEREDAADEEPVK